MLMTSPPSLPLCPVCNRPIVDKNDKSIMSIIQLMAKLFSHQNTIVRLLIMYVTACKYAPHYRVVST